MARTKRSVGSKAGKVRKLVGRVQRTKQVRQKAKQRNRGRVLRRLR